MNGPKLPNRLSRKKYFCARILLLPVRSFVLLFALFAAAGLALAGDFDAAGGALPLESPAPEILDGGNGADESSAQAASEPGAEKPAEDFPGEISGEGAAQDLPLGDAPLTDEFLDGTAAKNSDAPHAAELGQEKLPDNSAPVSEKPEKKKPGRLRNHFEHDTLYMKPASRRLRLRASVEGYGTDLDLEGTVDEDEFSTSLKSSSFYTLNLTAYYRGFSLSVSVNPLMFNGEDKDFETYFDWYGNWFGADISYSSTNTLEGDLESGGSEVSVSSGIIRQQALVFNGYFVWSGNKFSYPAALGPSWRQLRSAGSFMLGMGAVGRKIEVKESEKLGSNKFDFQDFVISVGVGYGYNFVPAEGWLLHLSTLPQFVAYNYGRMKNNGNRNRISTNFPDLVVVGRLSVTKYFGRYFAGLMSTVNTYNIGDGDEFETSSVKWQARIFFGIQL